MSPKSPARPRIAVFGVGAVGGYFGGALARAGHDVTFIARGRTAVALRRHGLRIEGVSGDFAIDRPDVVQRPEAGTPEAGAPEAGGPEAGGPEADTPKTGEATPGTYDLVILGVKAWQVPDVAPSLEPLLGEGSAVLPLQNGVEAADQLAETLGRSHVLGGLCRIFSHQVGPAHIRHVGAEPWVGLGELDNRASDRVEAARRALEDAGVAAEIPDDIRAAVWRKFLFVTAVGGVGAVARAPIGELRTDPRRRRQLRDSMTEIEVLAGRIGASLPEDVVDTTMDFVDGLPADNVASMSRDLIDGRPSELEAQLGAVVRLAAKANVEVPLNRELYEALVPLEREARGLAS